MPARALSATFFERAMADSSHLRMRRCLSVPKSSVQAAINVSLWHLADLRRDSELSPLSGAELPAGVFPPVGVCNPVRNVSSNRAQRGSKGSGRGFNPRPAMGNSILFAPILRLFRCVPDLASLLPKLADCSAPRFWLLAAKVADLYVVAHLAAAALSTILSAASAAVLACQVRWACHVAGSPAAKR